jgi:hypothetical protein
MTLTDYRETYYTFSAKASDISRQLSFAGIALIWVFKIENGGPLAVPAPLHWPAFLFAAALAFDLLHSVCGTFIWGIFARYHERKGTNEDEEIDAPAYFNWPILACFCLKLASLASGYALVLSYLYGLIQTR